MRKLRDWDRMRPIAEAAVAFYEQGMNQFEIAKTLNSRGIPSHSGSWSNEKVSRLLQRAERNGMELPELFDAWAVLDRLHWESLELPELDCTDGGFCWTRKELEEASRTARLLVGYKPRRRGPEGLDDFIEGQMKKTKELS